MQCKGGGQHGANVMLHACCYVQEEASTANYQAGKANAKVEPTMEEGKGYAVKAYPADDVKVESMESIG